MAKASLTLPNGTIVHIEGTTDEIRSLLQFYGGSTLKSPPPPPNRAPSSKKRKEIGRTLPTNATRILGESGPNLAEIVTLAKNCDDAEKIEKQILDCVSRVNRTLLPLFLVHEYLDDAFGLSSGDITKITTDLGVPVSMPNASKTLSGSAAKYVIGDKVRKKGQAVRYKLSRRGVQYLKAVIAGKASGNES